MSEASNSRACARRSRPDVYDIMMIGDDRAGIGGCYPGEEPLIIYSTVLQTNASRQAYRSWGTGARAALTVIPTRVKADSFRGFQSSASQPLWRRTGGS